MEEELRSLEDLCLDELDKKGKPTFETTLLDNKYCSLHINKAYVECSYRDTFQDHNGLYRCMYYEYNKELYN